ncbi:hypothetical protein DFH06DRAFT_1482094 [Mycena polygramma]|nr:hypothetical protein DFH06DRAFT_1482094 [Mycena polygramma]
MPARNPSAFHPAPPLPLANSGVTRIPRPDDNDPTTRHPVQFDPRDDRYRARAPETRYAVLLRVVAQASHAILGVVPSRREPESSLARWLVAHHLLERRRLLRSIFLLVDPTASFLPHARFPPSFLCFVPSIPSDPFLPRLHTLFLCLDISIHLLLSSRLASPPLLALRVPSCTPIPPLSLACSPPSAACAAALVSSVADAHLLGHLYFDLYFSSSILHPLPRMLAVLSLRASPLSRPMRPMNPCIHLPRASPPVYPIPARPPA